MAEDLGQAKTEDPTPRRRQEAREQGRVAVSAELAGALLLLLAAAVLWWGGPALGGRLLETVRAGLRHCHYRDLTAHDAQAILAAALWAALALAGPLFGLLFATAVGVMAVQVGFHALPDLVAPRWEKLDPSGGLGRLVSVAGVVRGLTALAKVALAAAVAYAVLRGAGPRLAGLCRCELATASAMTWSLALRLALAVAAALVVVGVADYGYQRYRIEQNLRMTRQELKDEIKREEGDPHVKARMRKLARAMSQRRMLRDVPRAAVVITNPTHLAIALRYDRGRMAAPRVVARGAGHVARRIVEVARRHAVPVVERRPIAQALYRAVKVGQDIPAALYHAVAEVLAFVYRQRGLA